VVLPRSGLGHAWHRSATGGLIDSDYQGQIFVFVESRQQRCMSLANGAHRPLVVVPVLQVSSMWSMIRRERARLGAGSTGKG
jgi:dUTPase